ncbi:DUF5134 domain-containing protein [Streptomyces sediminimaris]|uniref:DUF5134 domain-containing protein n=1 Tax=Streptomyces sediminimaris TaxID=3383721 RepID=UPI00399A8757
MGGPPLVGWLLTALGTATGVLCAVRSRAWTVKDRCERRIARAEAVMGVGMALMAAPALARRTGVWGPAVLAVVFVALAVRALLFARGEPHRLHHTIDAAVMAYMAVVMAVAAGGMTPEAMAGMRHGHAPMGSPLVDLALLGYYIAYVLWAGTRLVPVAAVECAPASPLPVAGPRRAAPSVWQAPAVGTACRLSLAIGMLAMVLTM